MILYPPAKINLGLRVVNRREDGFHNIETVFYPTGLTDILEFLPDKTGALKEDRLSITGLPVPGLVDENLLIKACRMLRERVELPYLMIHLHKRIPMGAGLGGGSSDAAFLLTGFNQLSEYHLPDDELEGIALKLGSDCPFFLHPRASYGQGRGEVLEAVHVDLAGYYLYLLNPGIHVSTGEAYAAVDHSGSAGDWVRVLQESPDKWRDEIVNAFEKSVFKTYPEIEAIKSGLYEAGAVFASMSGSGSSVFGIFKKGGNLPDHLQEICIWQEFIR
ncbi:MAG: 4-(cytidine 5'-diphospho)-2-C-methyl-D-erythritol kinase [Bacteroidetes bacterium]|jgi:4-diphosphocytidyl-2-C-methyl-D-erythritol kinase|nr:4-(cytidine 5'-diphospho)-2-C-methyl-D-erythritol kinase [Bacteroidota bacterium]MBT3748956.1 4-(cytidine 5'-diphospho)-2-C-methyl-D-erythritol kinase [Bacteroidota bacterium]MBT4400105.1 4-(cytidine 5'-diphospho)-2-C-methyl-D-erythritol kinase [Bacteroidota bacterium]MBT4411414.1 4-(cytidine 5'-diphospho)-2-C-methyl-D-erythritol kinase [Bacteroidota bacterium]MBT5425953.1 4-(cytidine 5'-diphospho)-2-C-methyl-D-erythritol kinase [Bacteroidota bacterium]